MTPGVGLWPLLMQTCASVLGALLASSGFWAYLQKRDKDREARTELLLGLAYDRISHVGMGYLRRGWIDKDEYRGFMEYLYAPYLALGGNGLAKKIADEVSELPIRTGATE